MTPAADRGGPGHVIVVGMHRSGTSAVASAVAHLGLDLPDESDLIAAGPFNERGYWESRRFLTFNNAVLAHLGGTWSAPPAPPQGWEGAPDATMASFRADARDFARREFTATHTVLKDPRLCITLPLWRTAFDRRPVGVLVLRDPLEVARSLEHRDGFPCTFGLALWRRYLHQAVRALEGMAVHAASYRRILDDPVAWAAQVASFLEHEGVEFAGTADDAARSLDPGLRHHGVDAAPDDLDDSPLVREQRDVLDTLTAALGAHTTWNAPDLPPEPHWVGDLVALAAAGESVTYAAAMAERELTWIKRSRLFALTRAAWRLTATGPELSGGSPETGRGPAPAATVAGTLRRTTSRLVGRARSAAGGHGSAPAPQIAQEINPPAPDTLDDFRVFAVIKCWMDEDIIEATVENARCQGVDEVFLVDNGSTDETLARATAAGAVVAEVYESDSFDGRLVQPLVNAVVARESLRSRAEHVWWLLLDSDEFPEGPGGMAIRDYLAGLDRRFRIVGASFVNHVPTGKPEYVEGFHPIDFQPRCYPFEPANWTPCPLGHWKHPLQRFDRHGQFVVSNDGSHGAVASEQLIEPAQGIVVHHFQYRDEAVTRAKLELVCGPGSTRGKIHESAGWSGFARRRRSLDAVYTQRWDEVDDGLNRCRIPPGGPQEWPDVDKVRRWYSEEDLSHGRVGGADPVRGAVIRAGEPLDGRSEPLAQGGRGDLGKE